MLRVLSVLTVLLVSSCHAGQRCPSNEVVVNQKSSFEDADNKAAESARISTVAGKHLMECMKHCSKEVYCLSAVFDGNSLNCKLYNTDVMTENLDPGEKAVVKDKEQATCGAKPRECRHVFVIKCNYVRTYFQLNLSPFPAAKTLLL